MHVDPTDTHFFITCQHHHQQGSGKKRSCIRSFIFCTRSFVCSFTRIHMRHGEVELLAMILFAPALSKLIQVLVFLLPLNNCAHPFLRRSSSRCVRQCIRIRMAFTQWYYLVVSMLFFRVWIFLLFAHKSNCSGSSRGIRPSFQSQNEISL